MTRRPAVALTLAALCAMAAAAIGRGVLDDAVAAARAEERAVVLADAQEALTRMWGIQSAAMLAGQDAAPVAPEAVAPEAEPSPFRCQDVPPSVAPASVTRWCSEIDTAAGRWGLDPRALTVLVAIESAGNPGARSWAGAQGLGQLMPGTAEMMRNETGLPCDAGEGGVNLDPAINLACSAKYLAGGLRAAAEIWRAGDEAAHVGAAGIGYHDGHGVLPRVVTFWRGGGHVCEPVGADGKPSVSSEGSRWCRMAVDAWQLMTASPAVLDAQLGVVFRPRP